MSERKSIIDLVYQSIKNYIGDAELVLGPDSQLKEDFDLDSTEMVCLAVDLEKMLGCSLKGIKFSHLKTPNDIAAAVEQKMLENGLVHSVA